MLKKVEGSFETQTLCINVKNFALTYYYSVRENKCKRSSARTEKREEEEEEQTHSPFTTRLRLVSSKRKHKREKI